MSDGLSIVGSVFNYFLYELISIILVVQKPSRIGWPTSKGLGLTQVRCRPPNLSPSSPRPGWDTSYSWGWTRPGPPMDRTAWMPWCAKFSTRWPIPLFACCPGASLRASLVKVLEPRTRRYLGAGSSSTLLHWNRWSEDGTILTPGAGIILPLDIIGTTSGGTKWKTLQWQMLQKICIANCWTSSWNEWEKCSLYTQDGAMTAACNEKRWEQAKRFWIPRYQTFANTAVPSYALVTHLSFENSTLYTCMHRRDSYLKIYGYH